MVEINSVGGLARTAAVVLALLSWFAASNDVGALPVEALRGVPSLAPVVNQVADGVATVVTLTRGPSDPLLPNEVDIGRNSGAGVFVDAERGYVHTNAHVVEGFTRIVVELRDGRAFDARVVGPDIPRRILPC